MKKILLFLFCIPLVSLAQEQTQFTIIEHTVDYDIIKAKIGKVQYQEVITPNGIEKRISLQKGSQLIEKGAPDLPKLAISLIVPNARDGQVEIVSSSYNDITNLAVAPSKGKVYRHEKIADFPYTYGKVYNQNAFYPSEMASFHTPYILRDLRAQTLHLYPVKYNPVSKTLRTYDEIIFKVTYNKPATENVLYSQNEFPTAISSVYNEIYKYQFLNYKTLFGQYAPLPQHGKMLILCANDYASAMPEFIEWKERKGYEVFFEITDTITGGPTEANLLSRVSNYYQQEQITYLLIVGDATDIPAQNSYWNIFHLFGPSDWAYAYQSGNDHYPEFIVGRFSADTLLDVVTQVKRTLDYERDPYTGSNWMRNQVALGSDQGPGDKGQYDHVHLRTIADSNKYYGNYVFNYEFFDGTHGGADAPGPPPVNSLGDAINAGVGLINYCGHGSTDMFTTSTFIGASQMPNLTNNNGEWPFIFSTACINGNFVYATCLAENFLRARDSVGNPKGAIAAIMSSINQSWDPPMQGQDEMNAILNHNRPGTYQTTFGAIASSGVMSTNDHYNTPLDSNGGNEIADTWVVFGDPSVQLVTGDYGNLNCTHNSTIGVNSTKFEVICPQEYAQIGLYYQNDFLASAVVQNGKAIFEFPAVLNLDTIFVTATKQNFKPYLGIVEVTNGMPFGIDDLARHNIQVYPNPTSGTLVIKDQDHKVKSIRIVDLSGKILLRTNNKQVDMSKLAGGVYHIILRTKDDKEITTRVSKY